MRNVTPVRIRRAGRPDLEAISIIERQSYGPEERWELEDYQEDFDEEGTIYLVAEAGGAVIGYAIGDTEDGLYVTALTTTETWRGRGIGHALLQELIAVSGAAHCVLDVRADNHPAIGLYRKFGFETTAHHPDHYGPGVHAVEMTLTRPVPVSC